MTVASAVEGLCQAPIVGSTTKYVFTCVLPRDYLADWDAKEICSLSGGCILVHKLPSVVSSILLVSIDGGPRVMDKLGNRR